MIRLEAGLRWCFTFFLVCFLAYSIFGSQFRRALPLWISQGGLKPTGCQTKLSRDIDHTDSLDLPQLEALLNRVSAEQSVVKIARQACRKDSSLKAIYMRRDCEADQRTEQTVLCP